MCHEYFLNKIFFETFFLSRTLSLYVSDFWDYIKNACRFYNLFTFSRQIRDICTWNDYHSIAKLKAFKCFQFCDSKFSIQFQTTFRRISAVFFRFFWLSFIAAFYFELTVMKIQFQNFITSIRWLALETREIVSRKKNLLKKIQSKLSICFCSYIRVICTWFMHFSNIMRRIRLQTFSCYVYKDKFQSRSRELSWCLEKNFFNISR